MAVTKCAGIWVVIPPLQPPLCLVNYTLLWCTNNSTRARWLPTNTHADYIRSTRVNRLNTHPSSLTMRCKNTHTCVRAHTHRHTAGWTAVSHDEVRPVGASHNPDWCFTILSSHCNRFNFENILNIKVLDNWCFFLLT